jgi:hypothetical protein
MGAIETGPEGSTKYGDNPITIVDFDGDTVTFQVTQTWKSDRLVDWIATEYDMSEEDVRCDKEVGVEPEQSFIYKAFCVDNEATVTVYVHEDSFATSDDPSIPAYCSESTEVGNKVAYIFTLPCDCDTHPSVTPTPPPTSYCGYYDISFDESGKTIWPPP